MFAGEVMVGNVYRIAHHLMPYAVPKLYQQSIKRSNRSSSTALVPVSSIAEDAAGPLDGEFAIMDKLAEVPLVF